jgi:hypothetical protein
LSLVDRFTRDRVSKVVWGLCLVVALGLLAFAIVGGGRAVEDRRAEAEARAATYATTVVEPSIGDASLHERIEDGPLEQLRLAVDDGILIDGRVVAVRLWRSDGQLLFATDDTYDVGTDQALNTPQLRAALADGSPVTISERSAAEDLERASELITYVPVASTGGAEAVVEIVQDFEATVGAVASDWFLVQLLAGALALIFLVLTILSFREPIARIGAGVGFVAEAVPRGFAVIEEDRLRAVNDVYALAQERVLRLKERLRESENARLATEGELQRILSKFESPKRSKVEGSIPTPAPPVHEVKVTTPEPVEPLGSKEPEVASTAEPSPEAEPEPVEVAQEPVAEEPVTEEPAAEVAQESEPIVIPESEEVPATPVSTSVIQELVGLEDDDEDDAMIARELLLRLMETEVPLADTGVDPGEIRAKLARTAARKKPGGGDRRLEEESARRTPPGSRDR